MYFGLSKCQENDKMQTISIKNSTIYIGESYKNIESYLPDAQVVLVTDENVYSHYASFVNEFVHIVIPAGEVVKSWQTVEYIVGKLLDKKADRHTFLLGFGGGVITDIVGFVAAIYMRGIRFGFVATSLLAQVDASLGGKNGINFHSYKNMLGTFNSPDFVICDANLLKTLPTKELRSGFGEIIKHSLIQDIGLFRYLEKNTIELLNLNAEKMEYVIEKAIGVKAKIVQADWQEQGERKKLNFGHTLGHAVENNTSLTHGEAVAVGMFWAARWSVERGYLQEGKLLQIRDVLVNFGLPVRHNVADEILMEYIGKDKKKKGSSIDFVFLKELGEAEIIALPMQEIIKIVKEL